MTEWTFPLFEPFSDRMRIALFTKQDNVFSDAQAAQSIGQRDYVGLHQIHGNTTVIVDEPSSGLLHADGMATSTRELALCIRSADCQTFAVYEPTAQVAGLLHVGWRGLIAGAIPAFFTALEARFGISPQKTYVAAGPSLCKKCAEFTDPHTELGEIESQYIEGRHVDLRAVAKNSLLSLGVPPHQLEHHPDCTCCSPEAYWTYRGGDAAEVKKGKVNRVCCVLLS